MLLLKFPAETRNEQLAAQYALCLEYHSYGTQVRDLLSLITRI